MKNIILVQPQNGLNEASYAPLGLISLAAYIRNDFNVKIVDLRFDPSADLYRAIDELRPLAVGFTMLTGSCIIQIIEISRKIKEKHPEIKIVVGGIHPTFFPEQTLLNPFIDFVVVNEAEKAFLKLLKLIEGGGRLEQIESLGWKDKNKQPKINVGSSDFMDMNELPMPAWDLIDVEKYVRKLSNIPGERVIDFYTSKGCPYPCSFCYNLNFNKRKWRAKSAQKAADEMEFLYRRYGINYFIIHDDNFVVDKERALEFAGLIIAKGLKVKYSIDMRVDFFEYEFMKKLKESGFCEVRVGCESGSNRILKEIIQKGITAEQTIKAVQIAKSLDIKLILSFVIGWPTETVEERQQTIDLIIKLQKNYPKTAIYPLWIYIPYPGTNLFQKAVDMGFEAPKSLEDWGRYFWGKAYLPWLKNKKEYEMIHELSPFAWYNKSLATLTNKSFKNIIRHLLIKTFRPFVLFRFKNNFWKFPVEAKMISFLKKIFQRSIKRYDKFVAVNFKR
jgi:radical SAM superfamily enzyme YgiQ (UPF0313 family)